MTGDQMGKLEKIARMMQSFSPAAPVDDHNLFAYREAEIMSCVTAIFQRGLHIALFGERGVGKTSLANVLPKIIENWKMDDLKGYRIDCNTDDTYQSLWLHIFKEVGIDPEGGLEPEDIRRSLATLGGNTLIVIDELDRMENNDGLSLLADTIKTLSDHSVPVTLMLVGVADSLMNLMGEHASIVRSLNQVQMPRMSAPELGAIIDKGLAVTGTEINDESKSQIINLSEGLPHYVHLLVQSSGVNALQDDRESIQESDVLASMKQAVDTHSFKTEYDIATSSPQPETLFAPVLLACAYAPRDALGFFRPADVREPLSIILEKEVDIPIFQGHLVKFTDVARGSVLTREGLERKFRYRFRNPLLQPYTKIRAIAQGELADNKRERLDNLRESRSKTDAAGQGGLFE